jgi:uncharacterized repeat protein (TIGR01451 family)
MRLVLLFVGLLCALAVPSAASAATADLSLAVTGPPTTVPGQLLTHTFTITNRGPDTASGISWTAPLPVFSTFISLEQTSGPAFSYMSRPPLGATGGYTPYGYLPSLDAGQSVTVDMVLRTPSPPKTPSFTENTYLSASSFDPVGSNNAASFTTDVAHPDLVTTVAASPNPARTGGRVAYDIDVFNGGSGAATPVTVTTGTPSRTTFASYAQTAGPAATFTTPAVGAAGNAVATIPSLDPGATAHFVLTVAADPTLVAGTLRATATAATPTPEWPVENNRMTATSRVGVADLAVRVSPSPDPVPLSSTVLYRVVVTNNGPDPAGNVSLTEDAGVRPGVTFLSAEQKDGPAFAMGVPKVGDGCCLNGTGGTIPAGGSATFAVVWQVAADTPGDGVRDAYSVRTGSTDPDAGNNAASATAGVLRLGDAGAGSGAGAAAFGAHGVDLSVAGSAVVKGRGGRMLLSVANRGDTAATKVKVTGKLPRGLRARRATVRGGKCVVRKRRTVVCTIASLAPGGTANVTITVSGRSKRAATATVSAGQPDASARDNTARVAVKR